MSAEPARSYFGIGEVIAQLRAEFPDVSVSKIRFLESEGLIQPARSPSGYRRFAPADVERLRYILTVQRDNYLPLRVIRDQLHAGEEAAGGRQPGTRRLFLSRRELLEAAGIDDKQLTELEEFGLVTRLGRQYPAEALDAVRALAELGRYGVHARHLRVLRASAEREIALIEQIVAPILHHHTRDTATHAGQSARQIAALVVEMHAALIKMGLADAGFSDRGVGSADP
jgi:DNA-binding transcriptional MerR regulator